MKPVISFRDIKTQEDVAQWSARIEREWPERDEVIRHILTQVQALPVAAPHIVELCPGTGRLAEALLTEIPQLTLTGFDFSKPLLAFAQNRLRRFGNRANLIRADLNQEAWLQYLNEDIHAIVSMQSLHDLGGETELDRIYGLACELLAPGGFFLNADLIVAPGQELPNNPGRRSIPRHLELLELHGYNKVACMLEVGGFGCFVGWKE